MNGDYWIKLYMEILDDAKMATLPDRLWRHVIELFLIAGRHGKGGHLPDTKQMAWILRIPAEDLQVDLEQIALTGIIQRTDTGWFVPNFERRQAPSTGAERVRMTRERDRKSQYYGVTDLKRNVTQINRLTETETDTEPEAEAEKATATAGEIYRLYESNIGLITPLIADSLDDFEKEYPPEWIRDAFREAVDHNARNLRYIGAILSSWKKKGYKTKKTNESMSVEAIVEAFKSGTL